MDYLIIVPLLVSQPQLKSPDPPAPDTTPTVKPTPLTPAINSNLQKDLDAILSQLSTLEYNSSKSLRIFQDSAQIKN